MMKKDTRIWLLSTITLGVGGGIFLFLNLLILGGGWLFISGYCLRSFLHRLFWERDTSPSTDSLTKSGV
jgi:multisubunit Na+/H+ antiporter MnhB subunit